MKKYFYSDGKEKKGPFSFEELKNENITKETLVWFEGLEDWKPVKEIEELEDILQLTPPPIPTNEIEPNSVNHESEGKTGDSVSNETKTKSYKPRNSGMFSNSFSFEGRIRRTEYGITLIVYFILYMLVLTIVKTGESASFFGLAYFPMIWFLWAQGAKRCHDLGNSGWWQLIPFYVFWMLFVNGEQGIMNTYGVNPKI